MNIRTATGMLKNGARLRLRDPDTEVRVRVVRSVSLVEAGNGPDRLPAGTVVVDYWAPEEPRGYLTATLRPGEYEVLPD